MKNDLMGWQPEHANNKLAYVFGFIGALYQSIANINLPLDGWSKLLEALITAGLCGFFGMLGKWLFEITKKYLTEYFQSRKNKTP
jgi:hypothetical protein